MPFVIFPARSRSVTSGSISEWALLHAVKHASTMEAEPRIAKQDKCHHCCSCKKLPGKGDVWWGKKGALRRFWADQKIASSWEKENRSVWGHPIARATRYCLLPDILTTSLQKSLYSWQCKIRKFIVTAFHCEESTHRK